ncbi:MAG TPA: glutaredoxin domain-containing protein [Steroidobacteraceae bacterium]|nr:glutaredoxin domain-containing protein [Steroidobacteraceae bacterium]
MTSPAITVYTASFCGHCLRALALLQRRGIDYTEVSVEDHPGLRDELVARSGRRNLPQVYLGDRYLGGATELAELDRNGELDRLRAEGA